MKQKQSVYEILCDGCRKKLRVGDTVYGVNVGPCGLTDYYRDEEVCTTCYKRGGDKKQYKYTLKKSDFKDFAIVV